MRGSQYTVKNIVIVALIVLCTVSIDITWKFFLENSARIQARYNLEQVKVCVNDLLLRDDKGRLTRYRTISDNEITEALKTCARKMRISPTGDVFAFDLSTKKFVFDPSLDCYLPHKKMTEDSICTIHKDKQACVQAIHIMSAGYDSSRYTRLSWKFDESPEYLEWKILPDQNTGFDGLTRGGKIKPHQVVVVQGGEEDELLARYKYFRMAMYIIGLFAIMANLALSAHNSNIRIK